MKYSDIAMNGKIQLHTYDQYKHTVNVIYTGKYKQHRPCSVYAMGLDRSGLRGVKWEIGVVIDVIASADNNIATVRFHDNGFARQVEVLACTDKYGAGYAASLSVDPDTDRLEMEIVPLPDGSIVSEEDCELGTVVYSYDKTQTILDKLTCIEKRLDALRDAINFSHSEMKRCFEIRFGALEFRLREHDEKNIPNSPTHLVGTLEDMARMLLILRGKEFTDDDLQKCIVEVKKSFEKNFTQK